VSKMSKPQRIRDPVHNLIEFGTDDFESTLWRLVQTRPFQRLRRIRQLGFSEFVFPGATHTRFAHSIGVFHTARQLMQVIKRYCESHSETFKDIHAKHALTAALLHDIGHGMFSHSFESIGKEFGWPMARHELVSQKLILDSQISEILDKEFSSGFAQNVADIIVQKVPSNLYGSVVSSQFDADRLDYMQRDRLMTGVQSSGVDLTWLLANLEIGTVKMGVDDADAGEIQTLVLGPKASNAAESYVLSLFHLYPNVYYHKTTRGAEKVFQALMRRLVQMHRDGQIKKSGLSKNHPIVQFLSKPDSLERAAALDDTVLWGSLPMLLQAEDQQVKVWANALHGREILRCIDIRQMVEARIPRPESLLRKRWTAKVTLVCESVVRALKDLDQKRNDGTPRFLIDASIRNPYKRFEDSKSPLNQILIRVGDGPPIDMAELSSVVRNAEPFNLCRAYVFRDDKDVDSVIKNVIRTKVQETPDEPEVTDGEA
jgi:uncharacterized protein